MNPNGLTLASGGHALDELCPAVADVVCGIVGHHHLQIDIAPGVCGADGETADQIGGRDSIVAGKNLSGPFDEGPLSGRSGRFHPWEWIAALDRPRRMNHE
jgi:hypothetical protein